MDNPIGIGIDIINKTNKVMKTQADVVQELIDDIINHVKALSDKIIKLNREINSGGHISDTEYIVKKNTIQILKNQSETLSEILRTRIGEIMLIKGIPYSRIDNTTDGNWDGDSKND